MKTVVMFLGGPLDHTTREVDAGRPGVPLDLVYRWAPSYRLTRVSVGQKHWWIYVLMGYDPPTGHLLNTMPEHLKP